MNKRSLVLKDTREYILEKAFRVFMSRGYDSVSITVLQHELGMSRGAMYRYFKGKDELFAEVVERYLFGALDRLIPQVPEDITLHELIELVYERNKRLFAYLYKEFIEDNFLNFTALMIQAWKHCPDFMERMKGFAARNFETWTRAIRSSIEKGEVRADIDVDIMAAIFHSGFNNPESAVDIGDAIEKGVEHWRRKQEYLYSLIKV